LSGLACLSADWSVPEYPADLSESVFRQVLRSELLSDPGLPSGLPYHQVLLLGPAYPMAVLSVPEYRKAGM
jgi:hypothetical protein